jgi:hypothetical protein
MQQFLCSSDVVLYLVCDAVDDWLFLSQLLLSSGIFFVAK